MQINRMITDDLPDPNFCVTTGHYQTKYPQLYYHWCGYDVPFKIQMGACLEHPDLPLSHDKTNQEMTKEFTG